MTKKYLLATATYNEKDNIKNLIKAIERKKIHNYDFLVIDDNSPDGTSLIIKKLAKKDKKIKLIIRSEKLGLDSAYKLIFKYAKKKKYKYLITFDADFSHQPKYIKKISSLLQKNKHDFIIGSRYVKSGGVEMGFWRYFISYFGNKLIKIVLRTNLNEHTTSLRGFNLLEFKKKKFDMNKIKSNGYSFFMEMIFNIFDARFRILEIPIIFKDRIHGKSKIPKIEIFRTIFNLIRIRLSF